MELNLSSLKLDFLARETSTPPPPHWNLLLHFTFLFITGEKD
jgi:hypothetical protein